MAAPGEVTQDALLRGRLPLRQPRDGYRTNHDALLLAAFACVDRPARRALDLGAGVGAIGLALVLRDGASAATLFEIDPALVELARANAADAGLATRVDARIGDVRAPLATDLRSAFDLVVANPPYERLGASSAPRPSRHRARVGDDDTLAAFARTARTALGKGGRTCVVFPAREIVAVFSAYRAVGLEPKRMRLVHPLPDRAADVVLLELKPARPGGLRVEPPLLVMSVPGEFTDEARSMME